MPDTFSSRRYLVAGLAMVLLAVAAPHRLLAHPHPHPHPHRTAHKPPVLAPADATSGALSPTSITGSGEFRYQYDPTRLVLPPQVKVRHGHGLVHDKEGNIYFTYESEGIDESTRVLVRFKPDGSGATLLGSDNALAHGAPHGLNIHIEKDGTPVLFHANNGAVVHKTTLDGKILWTQKWGEQMGNYKPTDVVTAPGGDRVMVADGYGSSMIHALRTSDGVYSGKSWGGFGAANGELNCPHGITYDPRKQLFLIADRGNQRLEYYHLNGLYHSTVKAKEIQAPCNADVWGDYVLVPDLNGPVVILDKENKAISVVEVSKVLGEQGFRHPHDAIWLDNGDIVVCTWNPGRLGYFKRVK